MNRFFQKHLIFIIVAVTLLLVTSILLKVDSSVRVLGLIEKKEENKVIKTQVSGSIIYNALAPFKEFKEGEIVLQIDDKSVQQSIKNYKDQLKLINKEQILFSVQLILIDDHYALEKMMLSPEIQDNDYKLLENFASNWKKIKENKNKQIQSLEKQKKETESSILIQSSLIENLKYILERSEKLFEQKLIRLRELQINKQEYARAKLVLSDYKNEIIDKNKQQQILEDNYLNSKLNEKLKIQNKTNDLELKILEIKQILNKNNEELKKYKVKSPINGVINEMISINEGSVLSSNQVVAEIASTINKSIIKAYLPSTQREIMKVNMPARISIINLNQNSPKIYDGFVNQISPNVLSNIDEPLIDKSMAYYLLEIESSSIDKDSYSSGQPVEIYITLFEQSVISYLIGPIKTFFNNTFNE
jgi:multidrug resistance efflux pump